MAKANGIQTHRVFKLRKAPAKKDDRNLKFATLLRLAAPKFAELLRLRHHPSRHPDPDVRQRRPRRLRDGRQLAGTFGKDPS
jgi:hypothetical protein